MRDEAKAEDLLEWYDRHARVMPWRVSPADRLAGVTPDPYRVWMSEIMLQQTTVAAVKEYFERFTALWPKPRMRGSWGNGQVWVTTLVPATC